MGTAHEEENKGIHFSEINDVEDVTKVKQHNCRLEVI